ncbi:hypothetical protein L249_3810 [Ophiocordyceps polyrhachis-furcata BCC 54312]|uniref:Uncharacterized protein n=1 Tax=Ophiocordyceps polyrhachis-furcata BCC 54312 TaxID=1330021 RepID=A0A367L5Z0_9HYPO|nr:hypothetical protein L249_3810 [Ophiocordyceps polyrhachis-furcata BCC 54312]
MIDLSARGRAQKRKSEALIVLSAQFSSSNNTNLVHRVPRQRHKLLFRRVDTSKPLKEEKKILRHSL